MIRAATLALAFASLPAAANEVLTIDEAAELLRVSPQKVLSMAMSRRIPARDVDGDWRLSRAALLEWLKGAGETLSATEMGTISGRGYAPTIVAQAGSPSSDAVGEKPATPTAEQVALRDQGALLKGGMRTLEFGAIYQRSERETFPIARTEARLLSAAFTGRYGLKDDLQATARITANYRQNDAQIGLPGESSPIKDSVDDRYMGDLSLSLLSVAQREAVRRPNVIWTLDAVVPTGPGDSGLGTARLRRTTGAPRSATRMRSTRAWPSTLRLAPPIAAR
jgi:excisionase family DNA binding protein